MFKKQPPKILMVEDNKSNHPLFKKAFEDAGFEVFICKDADDDFIANVLAVTPDIISMDLMIGKEGIEAERDGLQALELLKSRDQTAHIPVFILTNFFEENKVNQTKALGAVDFINLQGHSITTIPRLFANYLHDPKNYLPSHPEFRK